MSNHNNAYDVQSGVSFTGPEGEDIPISVAATFLQVSDGQLGHVFIGNEPILVIQPEYDADTREVTLNLTGVEINPPGLVEILEALLDAAKTMVERDIEHLKTLDEDDDRPMTPAEIEVASQMSGPAPSDPRNG